jgi:hypothetical protein
MARTKNKPVLKRSAASNNYIFQRAFLSKKNHRFISRYGSLSPLSQTFLWFEKYWLDNKFGFQPFSFQDLFRACDKTKFPWFCRKHILYDGRASVWRYTKKLRSYAKYFFDALLGPDRKFNVCFDPMRGKILKTRVAMTFSEISDEVVGFIDNMDPTTGEIFESVGYNSMYTNLAGRSSEYVVPMFGILKFVAHSCRNPVKISRRPLNRSIVGSHYKCIQMLISRDKRSELLNAGNEVVMDYCYAGNQLPFSCCCSKCVVNLVDA